MADNANDNAAGEAMLEAVKATYRNELNAAGVVPTEDLVQTALDCDTLEDPQRHVYGIPAIPAGARWVAGPNNRPLIMRDVNGDDVLVGMFTARIQQNHATVNSPHMIHGQNILVEALYPPIKTALRNRHIAECSQNSINNSFTAIRLCRDSGLLHPTPFQRVYDARQGFDLDHDMPLIPVASLTVGDIVVVELAIEKPKRNGVSDLRYVMRDISLLARQGDAANPLNVPANA